MKKALTFFLCSISLIICGYFMVIKKEKCLFYQEGKCYTCQEKGNFLVGLPENCTLCPNRFSQYIEYDSLGLWACSTKKEEVLLPLTISNKKCPKEAPLRDILGHCYPCSTKQPVRIQNTTENVCLGKRYLTEFRLSEKSHKCPPISQIKNPEICLTCQGFWHQEKCEVFQQGDPIYCQTNAECSANEYCYPFRYPVKEKIGLCRPKNQQKWLCSDTDGYNTESATLFCERQNAHLSYLETIIHNKTDIFQACPNTKIWVYFKEGSLYLDSIKEEFPITNEAFKNYMGGDNFYALCEKD